MKQITNQQKKELFEVLIPYFESKPEKSWIIGNRSIFGKHCALEFLDADFNGVNNKVTRITIMATVKNNFDCELVRANNGDTYTHLGMPKQRVLAYLRDQVESLK